MFRARSKQQENIVNSIHLLTNFCMKECIKPKTSQSAQIFTQETNQCLGSCAKNVIQMRFNLKQKWIQDMGKVQMYNQKVWKQYLS